MDQTPTAKTAALAKDTSREGVEILIELARRINFASHQCDVPIVSSLTISNRSEAEYENLALSLSTDPPVIPTRSWKIDRLGKESEVTIRDRTVPLAGGFLAGLREKLRFDITLKLSAEDRVVATYTQTSEALARNEWGGADYMPELIAAFVMPNDPATSRLLRDASRTLAEHGQKSDLEGYQSKSRKRVWEIVQAIWSAVSARNLTYASPPASFERQGQKIRTPSDIERDQLATCLDTALLFASAIEEAGLNPLIVFTEGHALCGVWLQPQFLQGLTADDPVDLRKALENNELVLFETTLATSDHPISFGKATQDAQRQISEAHEEKFLYALDIKQARHRSITPLPGLDEREASPGKAVVERSVALESAPDLPPFDLGIEVPDQAEETPETRVDTWRRKLLDLSKRNRLLNLRPSSTAIPIFCPEIAKLEDLLADGKTITIIEPPSRARGEQQQDEELYRLRTGDDLSEEFARDALTRNEIVASVSSKNLEKGVLQLYRKARLDLQEGGSNTLFLALGMLRWCQQGDKDRTYRAPLILLPVKLNRKSAASKIRLTHHEDEPTFNLTLIEMLRQEFDIELGELSGELPTDESGVDVKKIWDIVRRKVRDAQGIEVQEDLVLSTFYFAKYLMWRDLSDRLESLKENDFVRHLIETPRDAYQGGPEFLDPREIDEKLDPSALFLPLNADSSQIVAVHASSAEGDFVLEGPPGTGKSETIGNIIAHNIASGKKVLFVSEKMAALDVVYRRMEAQGLGDFCLELHSNKSNKKKVLAQLNKAWETSDQMSDRAWRAQAQSLVSIRDSLNRVVRDLHLPGRTGISPRKAIARVVRYQALHPLSLGWGSDINLGDPATTPAELSEVREAARRLGQQYSALDPSDFEAFGNIAHDNWSYSWQGDLVQRGRDLFDAIGVLQRTMTVFCGSMSLGWEPETVEHIEALQRLVVNLPACADTDIKFAISPEGKTAIAALRTGVSHLGDYWVKKDSLSQAYPDEELLTAPLDEWGAQTARANDQRWPLRWATRARCRRSVRKHFKLGGQPTLKADLPALVEMRKSRAQIDELRASLDGISYWRGLDTDPATAGTAIEVASNMRAAMLSLASFGIELSELRELFVRIFVDERDMLEPEMPLAKSAEELLKQIESFKDSLESFSAHAGLDTSDNVAIDELASISKTIESQSERLNAWCAWNEAKRLAESKRLDALIAALESNLVSPNDAEENFSTAYCKWIAPLLIDSRESLKRFSPVRHSELIQRFRDLDSEITAVTSQYVRALVAQKIPSKGKADGHPGLGILSREIQKKARHKPVRQLISEMGESLVTLTPCLMMSPLSVAQFLGTDSSLFDLVVFDEASQITVWDAIGAIARGKNVVVVGDPKQMPPTNFFQKGASEADDEGDFEDLESILDEALAARVPHHRLVGHYRSRHESLIAFSNVTYYEGQLVTYPGADTRDSAVTFRRVHGVYGRGKGRTNPIEAQAVVEEAVSRLTSPETSHLTLGIVTLNSEQQKLIEDLLDNERRRDPSLESHFNSENLERVFIKNLETVQGDQRDTIMISTGYGPTVPGGRTMSMNFGPLNNSGGERRLNVAITRATTDVLVFSSFDASMIDLTRTSAQGVRDLKHYVDYADRGPVALGEAVVSLGGEDSYDSDFEFVVADGLRKRGWRVQPQVGISKFRIDLGIIHPDFSGKFLAGIECDGATYHSSPSARDRDRVRHIVLENLGWRLHRIWSTAFFLDPERVLDETHSALDALLNESRDTLGSQGN